MQIYVSICILMHHYHWESLITGTLILTEFITYIIVVVDCWTVDGLELSIDLIYPLLVCIIGRVVESSVGRTHNILRNKISIT